MKKKITFILVSFILLFIFTCQSAQAIGQFEPRNLVDKSSVTLKGFLEDPKFGWLDENLHKAKAIMILPNIVKGGFLIGGSGGTGVLLSRDHISGEWSYPLFYTLSSISLGLQAGFESAEAILFIMTHRGVDSMLTNSLKLGADTSFSAGPVGSGAKAATSDILV